MSGLAIIARELGASVTGSDRARSSYTDRLLEHGIEPTLGHRADNVPVGAEVVFSTAVPPDNPERRAAAGRELHRSDLLAQIAALRRCLAVTGTHGKTTTAAMIVHILRGCGLDPAYVVGGELGDTGVNAGWGRGEWIVVEADESDRSLLALWPEIAVLTNAELDHHSTYGSRLDLEQTLSEFMGRAKLGAVVWDRPQLWALTPGGALAYDATDAAMSPRGSRFHWRGLEVSLSVPGLHNAVNAAGALTASALAGADPARAAAALADFRGARRRFELLGSTEKDIPYMTITPTTPPRLRLRSRRPGRLRRRGWWRCSSRISTHARVRSRGTSGAPWRAPTSRSCSPCTRPASAPRTSPASMAT